MNGPIGVSFASTVDSRLPTAPVASATAMRRRYVPGATGSESVHAISCRRRPAPRRRACRSAPGRLRHEREHRLKRPWRWPRSAMFTPCRSSDPARGGAQSPDLDRHGVDDSPLPTAAHLVDRRVDGAAAPAAATSERRLFACVVRPGFFTVATTVECLAGGDVRSGSHARDGRPRTLHPAPLEERLGVADDPVGLAAGHPRRRSRRRPGAPVILGGDSAMPASTNTVPGAVDRCRAGPSHAFPRLWRRAR